MATRIHIPRTFELMNRSWTVKWMTDADDAKIHDIHGTNPLDHVVLGFCDVENAIIYLRKQQNRENMYHTFLHELFHAFFAALGFNYSKNTEERMVDSLGGCMHQFLKTKEGKLG